MAKSTFFSKRFVTLGLAIIFITGVILLHEVFQPDPSPERYIETLSPLQSTSIENIVEMNKLIISLALLVLGACAAILVQKYPNIKVRTSMTTTILFACILFAASSIFSGYVLYDNLIIMLSNNFFSPANELILWPQRLQFYSFFISVVLFGLFIINYFLNVETETVPVSPTPLLVKIVESESDETSQEGANI